MYRGDVWLSYNYIGIIKVFYKPFIAYRFCDYLDLIFMAIEMFCFLRIYLFFNVEDAASRESPPIYQPYHTCQIIQNIYVLVLIP